MTVHLHFLGAAGTVTGSCYMFRTEQGCFLVDCGMFQGPKTVKELNYRGFPFSPSDIDAVLLTHAHIDHSGLLPKLTRLGFEGPIWATSGTADLCTYMLPDAGHIQESEVDHLNRRNSARGRRSVEPIYTQADAKETLRHFRCVEYSRWQNIIPGVRARWWNAGHLLGSASIELEFEEQETLRVLCSGDIGPDVKLLETLPEAPRELDYLLCETTYGNTERPDVSITDRRMKLAEEVLQAKQAGGALIIPAFAVERTQELIVDLIELMHQKKIAEVPVFINSPLAIHATEVFLRHTKDLGEGFDLENIIKSKNLHFTETAEESRAIAEVHGFHIIIAASGMCDAGRIRHHLKQWLWDRRATVLLVGFQAVGTLGRFLAEGTSRVRIQGEEIVVKARIRRMDEYSGHADAPELVRWISDRCPIRRALFLVHGEPETTSAFAGRITRCVPNVPHIVTPQIDEVYDLSTLSPTTVIAQPPRLPQEALSRADWHNARSQFMFELNEALERLPDDEMRASLVDKLRRAIKQLE